MTEKPINILALVKGEERYIFLYDDNNVEQVRRTIGKFASVPELSFSWYDAAVLTHKIRHGLSEKITSERFQLPQVKP